MRVIEPAPRDRWHELLGTDRDAVAEQAPQWIDAMQARGYCDASRLYEFDDGTAFVLPLVRRAANPRLPLTGFGTGWGIGGVVGPGLAATHVSAIANDLRALPAVFTHVRPNPLQGSIWAEAEVAGAHRIQRRAHVVDLAGGAEETYRRFRKSGRRGVTKSERAGVQVTVHTAGDQLERYYKELFLASIGRWAARQREPLALAEFRAKRRDPLTKLQVIAESLGDNFRLYLGTVDGELAAGNIVLWGPNAHATRGALNYEIARRSNASYALDWAAIRDACEAGYDWYQLGESGSNENLSDYKERFGATAIDYAEYRFERVPLLAIDQKARALVKRAIGFRD